MSGAARFTWPKTVPDLDPGKRAIADDWMHYWHGVLPARYGVLERFNHGYPLRFLPPEGRLRTIEIGAGVGGHLEFEDPSRQDYHCVELRDNMAREIAAKFPAVTVAVADCQRSLPYEDGYFDRAVAIHVLEHLPDLPKAVAEVHRILHEGGIFSIVIPCDPGLAYECARIISSERMFRRRYKMPYRWLMRHEHVNSPAEVFHCLESGFVEIHRAYFPLPFIPLVNANICIGATYRRM